MPLFAENFQQILHKIKHLSQKNYSLSEEILGFSGEKSGECDTTKIMVECGASWGQTLPRIVQSVFTILHHDLCPMSHPPQVNASKKDTWKPGTVAQKMGNVPGRSLNGMEQKLHVLKTGLAGGIYSAQGNPLDVVTLSSVS